MSPERPNRSNVIRVKGVTMRAAMLKHAIQRRDFCLPQKSVPQRTAILASVGSTNQYAALMIDPDCLRAT